MLDKEIHIRFTLASVMRLLLSPFFGGPAVILILIVPWGSERAPAWVQAVGSILAIVVAIVVAHFQWLQQQQSQARTDADRLKKLVASATYIKRLSSDLSVHLYKETLDHAGIFSVANKIMQSNKILADVSYMNVPVLEAALGWVETQHAAQDLVDWLNICLFNRNIDPEHAGEDVFNEIRLRLDRAVLRLVNGAISLVPDIRNYES